MSREVFESDKVDKLRIEDGRVRGWKHVYYVGTFGNAFLEVKREHVTDLKQRRMSMIKEFSEGFILDIADLLKECMKKTPITSR